jgi:hypothetical protein
VTGAFAVLPGAEEVASGGGDLSFKGEGASGFVFAFERQALLVEEAAQNGK